LSDKEIHTQMFVNARLDTTKIYRRDCRDREAIENRENASYLRRIIKTADRSKNIINVTEILRSTRLFRGGKRSTLKILVWSDVDTDPMESLGAMHSGFSTWRIRRGNEFREQTPDRRFYFDADSVNADIFIISMLSRLISAKVISVSKWRVYETFD